MKTPALNRLFRKWKRSYPKGPRDGFHEDGIIDEAQFIKQRKQVLFVLAEPNSTEGNYSHLRGKDLREIFRERHPKQLTRNLSLWVCAILDGESKYRYLNPDQARAQLRRVAIMNLKKFSGTSHPYYAVIGLQAWHDRKFIQNQVKIMAPQLIFTCGERIHHLFSAILKNDPFWSGSDRWCWNGVEIINIQHPATRGMHTKKAFKQVVKIMRDYGANKSLRRTLSARKPAGAAGHLRYISNESA